MLPSAFAAYLGAKPLSGYDEVLASKLGAAQVLKQDRRAWRLDMAEEPGRREEGAKWGRRAARAIAARCLRIVRSYWTCYPVPTMPPLSRQEINDRFTGNVTRVRGLVSLYNTLVGSGADRPSVEHADVLRAAVIFVHAALEDLLRSTEELLLPKALPEALMGLRLAPPSGPSKDAKEKFTFVELSAYRGQSVDEVIEKAIALYLEKSNYNNIGEVKQALQRTGVAHTFSPAEAATMEAMMKRRHWIAHRADRNTLVGPGHHAVQPLGRDSVDGWISVVESFGKSVLAKL